MKVIVAGCDYRPRPHMVSWFAKAFRRLGCDVAVASSLPDGGEIGTNIVDPEWEAPAYRAHSREGGRPSAREAVTALGGADLFLMVDCGNDWAMINDAGIPYAYVWREGNPGEWPRVGQACGGAPVFCCMVGKGTHWPEGTKFLPFAVDRGLFNSGLPYDERKYGFCYTGRERGTHGLYNEWRREFGGRGIEVMCTDYVLFDEYQRILQGSKSTCVADSGRYIGSRGIEAMACGQVVFWDDGGGAIGMLAGFEEGVTHMRCQRHIANNGDYSPALNYTEAEAIIKDLDRWTAMSEAARRVIANYHTYEHRAETIATALGLQTPKAIGDLT